MDAFFASVEQLDNPDLRGKPVAVGGSGERSVVAAASYEARKFGVRSAMPSVIAKRLCPGLIFVKHNFTRYTEVSAAIMEIFAEYTDLIEPLSLDEAFLDVTKDKKNIGSATVIARKIRKEIKERTGLTASAGISVNKFLAKIASDYKKPNGLFVVKPTDAEKFIESLSIEQFYGVGKVTAERMHKLGIKTGADLKQWSEEGLVSHFGKTGHIYYQNVRAIDERPVEWLRIRKSVSSETTFEKDIDTYEELIPTLQSLTHEVIEYIGKKNFKGRTVSLKIKYADFKIISRSKTFPTAITDYTTLYKAGSELLTLVDLSPKVRLIGVGIKNIEEEFSLLNDTQLHIRFEEDK